MIEIRKWMYYKVDNKNRYIPFFTHRYLFSVFLRLSGEWLRIKFKDWLCIECGLVIFFMTIPHCFAQPFFVVGSKPSGMAGAYVSVEDDSMAFYWNPAKYALNKTTSLELPIGVELIATNDIVKELDDVEQTFRDENSTLEQFINEVNDLRKEKMGLVAYACGGINAVYNNYAISFLEQKQAAGNPYFKIIDEYGGEEPYLQIKYIGIQEYILSMSNLFADNLYWGVNMKVLVGKLDYTMPHAYKEKDVEKKVEVTLKGEQAQTTTKLGLDIGLLYQKNNLRYGLVIKNLNSPNFSYGTPSLDDYQLKQQIRAGISLKTKKAIVLALDCDVTKNDTLLNGYQSQNLAIGIEYPLYKSSHSPIPPLSHSPTLVLRCGWMKNLVENDIGNVYTLGLGLNFFNLQADISGAISGKKTKRSNTGEKYPVNLIGSAQLSYIF